MKVAVPKESEGMRRELNLFGAVSMIVGIVIGSGIFLGVDRVAAGTGSPWLMVLVWVLAGALTLMGALTYAELGTIFPKAGGEYVFLKEGTGAFAAFLSGWTAFTINLAGSAAALAVVFAEQLNRLKPEAFGDFVLMSFGGADPWLHIDGVKITAAALIGFLSIVNYFGVRYGGGIQMVFTALKGFLIVILAGAALLFAGQAATDRVGFFDFTRVADTPSADGFTFSGFLGLAMVAALFAYDGWTNVVRVGAELKNPSKNIPRAMLFGLLAIMVLYILVTMGYANVLGWEGFANAEAAGVGAERTVASNVASHMWGNAGEGIITVMILVSVFGALNGITLSGPRVYYAMSIDRIFPRLFGHLSRHRTPGAAILFQALLAIAFLMFFDFNALTDNVVFISFLFYALTAVGLIVLRRTHPDLPRPYKVWGYPVVPIAFIITSLSFVAYLLYDQVSSMVQDGFAFNDLNRLVGLLVVAAGLPVFFWYRKQSEREAAEKGLLPPPPLFGPDPYAEERDGQ